MIVDESLIKNLITQQRRAIKYYLGFAIGIVALGVAIIIASLIWTGSGIPENFRTLISIGGGFVSSLSTFQIKEILSRKEKIGVVQTLQVRITKLKAMGELTEDGELNQVEDLLWKIVEKTATG